MTTVAVGQFAVCPIKDSVNIYLAVGPQTDQVNTLAETSQMIADLFFNMLLKAHHDGKETIVLCAISTAIFAGPGKEKDTGKSFTKENFIDTAYNGAHAGINKFKSDNPASSLKIILNNWVK